MTSSDGATVTDQFIGTSSSPSHRPVDDDDVNGDGDVVDDSFLLVDGPASAAAPLADADADRRQGPGFGGGGGTGGDPAASTSEVVANVRSSSPSAGSGRTAADVATDRRTSRTGSQSAADGTGSATAMTGTKGAKVCVVQIKEPPVSETRGYTKANGGDGCDDGDDDGDGEKRGPLHRAIPVMPLWLAVLCCILNIVLPGVGKCCFIC